MKYLSVCSGIEAATCAWHPLGFEAVAFSEIEPFPCSVLAHHYPGVPNWGDMTRYQEWPDANVNVIVGGTPCQSFSVAGLRAGMDDPRGRLTRIFLAIAGRYRPSWVVWENVPGVLSSNGGRDFGAFLGALGELGYGFAYRILDAQYFGVPQRRRRVFVVGYLGDWRRAASVLFECASLRGDSPPRREAGENATAKALRCATGGIDREDGHTLIAHAVACHAAKGGDPTTDNYVAIAFNGRMDPVSGDVPGALDTDPQTQCVALAFTQNQAGDVLTGNRFASMGTNCNASGRNTPKVLSDRAVVRRLTPRECERLQGFPDDYTLVPYRKKPACDSPRYRAIGNSMAVPVMRWIGQRISAWSMPCGGLE